jgi:hypothetical protein
MSNSIELLRAVSKQAIRHPSASVQSFGTGIQWLSIGGSNDVHQVVRVSSGTHSGHFVPRRSRYCSKTQQILVVGCDVSHDEN